MRIERFQYAPVATDEPSLPRGFWFGIAVSRTHPVVTDRLLSGALSRLESAGVANAAVVEVAGAFELVAASRALANSCFGCAIALGAVIRGDTPHFDYICQAVSSGLASISASGFPVVFGVLTCDTLAQATDRAGGALGNKGAEAAEAALAICSGIQRLGRFSRENMLGL